MAIEAQKTQKKIWKVRIAKPYPDAHNHLIVGRVLGLNDAFVRMDCRTFHFGTAVAGPKNIKSGERGLRIIPWHRVEIVNELPSDFAFDIATLTAENQSVILTDNKSKCLISAAYESSY